MSANKPFRQQRIKPLPKGNSLFTPDASAARQAAERRSARPLLFLHQLPSWIAPLAVVVLFIVGLSVRGPGGAIALCGVAAVLAWLATLSWPKLAVGGRLGRILVITGVLVLAGFFATR
jgi:hypothetical protein